jgi:hypothetical protein
VGTSKEPPVSDFRVRPSVLIYSPILIRFPPDEEPSPPLLPREVIDLLNCVVVSDSAGRCILISYYLETPAIPPLPWVIGLLNMVSLSVLSKLFGTEAITRD